MTAEFDQAAAELRAQLDTFRTNLVADIVEAVRQADVNGHPLAMVIGSTDQRSLSVAGDVAKLKEWAVDDGAGITYNLQFLNGLTQLRNEVQALREAVQVRV